MTSLARRKKEPYRPGADPIPQAIQQQYGIPTVERRQHSYFSADQLAPGSPNGGVIRSRVKYLFTPVDQREALVEFALQDLRARGMTHATKDDIDVDQTSIDRNFMPAEYDAINWFCWVHAMVEGKRPGTVDYNRSSSGRPDQKLAYSEEEGWDREEYAHVKARIPKEHFMFLDWVAWCQYPEAFSDLRGQPPGKIRVSKSMFVSKDDKYLRGAADGYFKAVCQSIAHARSERVITLHRREMARCAQDKPRKIR